MDEFLGVMNDATLDGPGRAQKLVDLQTKAMTAMSEKAVADWTKLQETWQEEVRNDPVVGGEKLDANLGKISTLINVHGSPEVRDIFSQTGAGNNVHMVKFLTNIANALGEALPAPAAAPPGGAKSLAQKLYPSMK